MRQAQAKVGAEQRRPGAAGQHHVAAAQPATFAVQAGDLACRDIQAAHRTAGDDARAQALCCAGDHGTGAVRFGAAITWRVQRAAPACGGALGHHPQQLFAFQQPRVHAMGAGGLQPIGLLLQLPWVFAGVEHAATAKTQTLTEVRLPGIPQVQAGHGQGDFGQIAAHAAAPAPVARGLLGADQALFQ